MKSYNCLNCGIKFYSKKECRNRLPKFCSSKCSALYHWELSSYREKVTNIKKGGNPWNKGVKMWEGKEHPKGMLGKASSRKGMTVTEDTKRKLRESHIGIRLLDRSGENHWNWKNGISTLQEIIRNTYLSRQWKSDVFTRDNFTCQTCGIRGGTLNAHHKKSFSSILRYYEITTLEEALDCEELWNINNGVTLCENCHKKMSDYTNKKAVKINSGE